MSEERGPSVLEMRPGIEQLHIKVLPGGNVPRRDASLILGRKPQTLRVWKMRGFGPEPITIGGRDFYRLQQIFEFISQENTQPENPPKPADPDDGPAEMPEQCSKGTRAKQPRTQPGETDRHSTTHPEN